MSAKEIAAWAKNLAHLHDAGQRPEAEVQLRWLTGNEGTQARVAMDHATSEEYAEALRAGAKFPPIVVFTDSKTIWIADGFHRVNAHRSANKGSIRAIVIRGTLTDAILYAVGANGGLMRNDADKRRAIRMLFDMPDWASSSDRAIAIQAKVSHPLVAKVRKEIEDEKAPLETVSNATTPVEPKKRIDKNGKAKKLPTKKPTLKMRQTSIPGSEKPIAPVVDLGVERDKPECNAEPVAATIAEASPANDEHLWDHDREVDAVLEGIRAGLSAWPVAVPKTSLIYKIEMLLAPHKRELEQRDSEGAD